MSEHAEWIRARGIGRERFAAYLADYLTEQGYVVEREEIADPASSVVRGELKRMNPAVPGSLKRVTIRFSPTSGGAAGAWEAPVEVVDTERTATDRFVRELILHLERTVRTESHGTAKVQLVPTSRLPWQAPAATAPSGPIPRGDRASPAAPAEN